MEKELISVIVPVYNTAKYLRRCVDSILSQTYENLEIILVDDGSTDGESGKICDEYAKKDSRVGVIHKDNGGLSSARNAGLDVIKGNYISFIDSDDHIAETYLRELYDRMKEENSDIVISGYTACDEDGKILGTYGSGTNELIDQKGFWDWVILENREDTLYGAVVAWSKLYRAWIFKDIRFHVTLHEDEAILYDVISSCKSISVTDGVGYYYLQRPDSIMNKSYSVERLAASRIFIDRSEWFLSDGCQEYAERSLMYAIYRITLGLQSIKKDTPKRKKVMDALLTRFRTVGKAVRKDSDSLKFRIKTFIFSLSPELYMVLFVH